MSKKYLYIIIGILVLIIIGFATHETTTTLIIKDKEDGTTVDFGILKKKNTSTKNYTFKYVNKMHDSLKVYDVLDGCDCTISNVKKGFYLRNDTITVETNYNPNKYKDQGLTVKQIFLVTNKTISKFDTIYPLTLKGIVE
ncbi:DUF1573 domain-containing protein [Chryseobacterium formosus]|uniref:DUF1573 domain-containing protein n=1 Tax=Chryseobacterium formosus TaxID=1537363 RepID=A0ABT3XVV5_9FLAO|nr:DUF1573 domain-containing protein [Chryseobacterium formosus]MCX8525772.1 DUF1573 domain-containing protein [Chryseobacterium formosus]